jgi:hypothetical protein
MFELIKIIKYLVVLGVTNKIIQSVYKSIKILKKIRIYKKIVLLILILVIITLILIIITMLVNLNILEYKTIELNL